ncbi:stage v sporulation protein ae [Lucifera butyrica]|uniref:Stage v sporulation protein ae n=1 Tax=Lucifera butyrica TaxID=1351585 RepID=A0A498RAJ1_9FIRM|nr:stage V sporulation protein AE [Lucifera butyrica]VBB07980.1 stage v sporulation protein ae [Lucifera butyrica]
MPEKVRVILVTDGDRVAQRVIEEIAGSLGLRCISASAGNPTPISGEEIVHLLKEVQYDPVLVMFDDRGRRDKGKGEQAMEYVAAHPDIEVLGAVAVASNTTHINGIKADACINNQGKLVDSAVNKYGETEAGEPLVCGDTVDVLNHVDVPVIIGVGDVGKMDKADDLSRGAPVTRRAIEEILKRNGIEQEL